MPAQRDSRSENRSGLARVEKPTTMVNDLRCGWLLTAWVVTLADFILADPRCHEAPASTTGMPHLFARFEGRFRGGVGEIQKSMYMLVKGTRSLRKTFAAIF